MAKLGTLVVWMRSLLTTSDKEIYEIERGGSDLGDWVYGYMVKSGRIIYASSYYNLTMIRVQLMYSNVVTIL